MFKSIIVLLTLLMLYNENCLLCFSFKIKNIRNNKINNISILKMSTKSVMSQQTPLLSIDLTNDGSVIKEVLVKGTGKKIEVGDILAVEYTAMIKGSNIPFAKGDKEKFIVKDGSLIKGWDVGIMSMTVGEKSRIICNSNYAYGSKGVKSVIPPNTDIELQIKVLAWLGNQLRPESLFQKDLDIDPFIASTPESIQAEYDQMQLDKEDKYKGNIFDIYLNRIKNISFGFGGSGFFTSQSGEKAPWYLNPNLTFPFMITICVAAFLTVLSTGSVKEKGTKSVDLEISSIERVYNNDIRS